MSMISYNLALKLKEVGFPPTEGGWRKRKGADEWKPLNGCELDERSFSGDEIDNKTPNPTLSELIKDCGNSLWSLTRHSNIWQTNFRDGMAGETAGNTPEESVANLWLKINSKI